MLERKILKCSQVHVITGRDKGGVLIAVLYRLAEGHHRADDSALPGAVRPRQDCQRGYVNVAGIFEGLEVSQADVGKHIAAVLQIGFAPT